jgi:hypothetical protein
MFSSVEAAVRSFDFFRDTFSFRNELMWEYLVDENTGAMTTRKNDPPPTYAHHCFVVARSAKQFFIHARFDPTQPACSDREFAEKIRVIVKRHVDRESSESERIVFPGFSNLREFSAAHEKTLKANLGGSWQSYVNKRHWRMIFPFTKKSIVAEARLLTDLVTRGKTPVIHIFRFPQLTINHALLLYGVEKTETGLTFTTYDPNLPEAPSSLHYIAAENRFDLPRNIYWAGGMVHVYETYTGSKFSRPS